MDIWKYFKNKTGWCRLQILCRRKSLIACYYSEVERYNMRRMSVLLPFLSQNNKLTIWETA